MELLFIGMLALAIFIAFLMSTAKGRQTRLLKAVKELTAKRLNLKNEMEKVRLMQSSGELTEREAFTKLSHLENELADVEEKLIELKEKPFIRTLRKHEAKKSGVKEQTEAERAEEILWSKLDAKIIFAGFGIVIFLLSYMVLAGNREMLRQEAAMYPQITLAAIGLPEGGTYPGGMALIKAELKNEGEQSLKNLVVGAFVPEGSMMTFRQKPYYYLRIPELEPNGKREVNIPVEISEMTLEGEYFIRLQVTDPERLVNKTATAKLIVGLGSRLKEGI